MFVQEDLLYLTGCSDTATLLENTLTNLIKMITYEILELNTYTSKKLLVGTGINILLFLFSVHKLGGCSHFRIQPGK